MPKLLKITSISDIRKDKNGREYKLITLSNPTRETFIDEETGEVIKVRVQAKQTSITSYKESYLDGKPHFLWDAELGEMVMGSIETREVAPYSIQGREVSTYSTVVFGNPDHPTWKLLVASAFKAAGHPIMSAEPAQETKAAPKQPTGLTLDDLEDQTETSEQPEAFAKTELTF